MGRSEGSGALPSEFFISARHQAVCVSMATRYSRTRNLVASHEVSPQRRRTGTRNQANRPLEYTNPCGIVTPPVRKWQGDPCGNGTPVLLSFFCLLSERRYMGSGL